VKKSKKTLYIDALALVPEKKSGVGVTLEQTLEHLLKQDELKDWTIYLVVPLGKAGRLKKYQSSNVYTKTIYLPARVLSVLSRARLLPSVDWFLGTGVYLFPNYRNWPTWRSRSITYIYDVAYLKHPETVQVKNQKYLSRSMVSWLRRTDRIVTITKQVKYEIEKYLSVDERLMDIVPCGVDQEVFKKRSPKEIKSVKERYEINYDKYFIFVGNIEPRKNLDKLLDAYNALPSKIQNEYGLVFVGGDGWQNEAFYQKLKDMQASGKNVLKVREYVTGTDLPALYSGATMLIHPAIYEGFGITPLEAMACETPVVVSDISAIREVVKDAGLYFDPTDVKSIVKAIEKTLSDEDLVTTNIASGIDLSSVFSWQNTAETLFKVINDELSKGVRKHPVLDRLRRIYLFIDGKLLRLFGEKPYPPYAPPYSETKEQMRKVIFNDFMKEQPSKLQLFSKKIYLTTKHVLSVVLRKVFHLVRGKTNNA